MAKKRDFLAIADFSRDELTQLLERARLLKAGLDSARLTGKTLAMIFRKSSTRTRVSFEVGMTQLGGHALFLAHRLFLGNRAAVRAVGALRLVAAGSD